MDITEVRVKLMNDKSEKLQAFCSITISNDFVIRDLKIIEGASGPFVAMPSRKLTEKCHKCGCKNHIRANYCSDCGARLRGDRAARDERGRTKLHADIAHPINSQCREELQKRVLAAYQEELARSKQDGYVPAKYDEYEEEAAAETAEDRGATQEPRERREPQPDRSVEREPRQYERREPAPRPQQVQPSEPAMDDMEPAREEEAPPAEDIDAPLDSPLEDYPPKKNGEKPRDDFGSGIFT